MATEPKYACVTCHSSFDVTAGGAGPFFGVFALGLAVVLGFTGLGRDAAPALAAPPIAVAGVAMMHFGRNRCPRCGSHEIVPTTTPRGAALLDEVTRRSQTGS